MKTLVDTSVWIAYFKGATDALDSLLAENGVVTHPVVIGELSCGGMKNRRGTLADLKLLPRAKEADFDEVIQLIEDRRLYGKGLGFNDVQLLASALISGFSLLSSDKAVIRSAKDLGICSES